MAKRLSRWQPATGINDCSSSSRLSRDDALAKRLHGGDVVLFDGTLRTDDEMLRQGVRNKTGKLRTTQWR
jgi:hypothetical protein